jgi:hypothetical protein
MPTRNVWCASQCRECVGLFTLPVTPAKAWCSGQMAEADAFDACEVGPIPERIRNADRQREESILLCRPDSALLIERSMRRCVAMFVHKGDVAGALDSFKEALAILDSRAKSDSENTELQRDLSEILSSIASLQVLAGNREEAYWPLKTNSQAQSRKQRSNQMARQVADSPRI